MKLTKKHPLLARAFSGPALPKLLTHALNDREQTILDLRLGLGGKKPMTLAAIGKKFHITRERVRQLQNRALAKSQRALDPLSKPKQSGTH